MWSQLSVTEPHKVYIVLGGFTSLFMLCSSIIKERFYIGEATVATLCGVIFGPHAANVINPQGWGNTDLITLEFSRVVLVVQCFAVGVELPRAYMEKHWRSVVFLLVPVMTFGWLITSLFIWGCMGGVLNWLDSLVIAACVTATDPVLASSVVGKGKFAKRVPKHLRDLLSAESGCNDGMAFPFIYLSIYLVTLHRDAAEVSWHWIGITIMYECIFGAIYGVVVGYIARRLIRLAHEKDLIDRESFLVFYFVLALFCAGSGSMLGVDDLLVGFAAGVGFSNDGWFLEKTEESHVSNVIDLLINLAFFVYFGTIIPWAQYNSTVLGISPWRLVVIALLVLFFRRIPIMMALKPLIPDVKTWREALFAGHFGPIGVGAIFVAILARAELETDTTTPLAVLPEEGAEYLNIIELIWPITTFLVMASILVHGSSIAVFTLGKHINTLTITMSYTQAHDDGSGWMDRLPRIQSRSRTSISMRRPPNMSEESLNEKLPEYPAATLGLPRQFLRRQKEEDTPSRPSSILSKRRRRGSRGRAGGHVEESAISPLPRDEKYPDSEERSGSDTLNLKEESGEVQDEKRGRSHEDERKAEVYDEGDDAIIEDEEGNVLEVMKSKEGESKEQRQERINREVRSLLSDEEDEGSPRRERRHQCPPARQMSSVPEERKSSMPEERKSSAPAERKTSNNAPQRPDPFRRQSKVQNMRSYLGGLMKDKTNEGNDTPPKAEKIRPHRSGPARAFRIGSTIIVEDEDGEVIKQYDIPGPERKQSSTGSYANPDRTRQRLHRMSTYLGFSQDDQIPEEGPSSVAQSKKKKSAGNDEADDGIRFTVDGQTRRMTKADFIAQIEAMHPQKRAQVVEASNANERVKEEARADAREHDRNLRKASGGNALDKEQPQNSSATVEKAAFTRNAGQNEAGPEGLKLVTSNDQDIPYHSFATDLWGRDTAAQKRRRAAHQEQDQIQDGPPRESREVDRNETAAERRRREGALGRSREPDSEEEDYFTRHNPVRPPNEQRRTETTAAAPRGTTQRRPTTASNAPGTEGDETAAERRRREAALGIHAEEEGEEGGETAAEKRRREAALGVSKEDSDTDEDELAGTDRVERRATRESREQTRDVPVDPGPVRPAPSMGIRFADPEPRAGVARGDEEAGWGSSRAKGKRRLKFGIHRKR